MKIKDLFLSNLLFPAISFVIVSFITILNKKLEFVKIQNLIVLILISSLVVSLPALLVFLDIPFLPFLYLYIFLFFLLVGYFYMEFISDLLVHKNESINRTVIAISSIAVLFTGSYLFSIFFNLFSSIPFGLAASTCTYSITIPLIFTWAYKSLLDIPTKIIKIWKFNPINDDFDFTSDTDERLILLELELNRNAYETEIIKVKAKAPVKLKFGTWFQLFLIDYNSKYFGNPIVFKDSKNESFGWIFYAQNSLFREKKYIDPDLSIVENGLKDTSLISCKRVDKTY